MTPELRVEVRAEVATYLRQRFSQQDLEALVRTIVRHELDTSLTNLFREHFAKPIERMTYDKVEELVGERVLTDTERLKQVALEMVFNRDSAGETLENLVANEVAGQLRQMDRLVIEYQPGKGVSVAVSPDR